MPRRRITIEIRDGHPLNSAIDKAIQFHIARGGKPTIQQIIREAVERGMSVWLQTEKESSTSVKSR